MAGDAETGVTIIKLVKELDAGPIAAQRAFAIEPDDDAGAVYAKAAAVAVELLDEVLADPAPDVPTSRPGEADVRGQDQAGRIACSISTRPARELVDLVRALSPHIGARAELHGRERHDLAGAGRRRRLVRAGRGPARRRAPDGVRGMAARAAA